MLTGEILALINENPIWAAGLLPIYSMMHTVTLTMETPSPDQGMAVGVGENKQFFLCNCLDATSFT